MKGLKNLPYFDIIVSNPPYIQSKTISSLQPEIYQYEPQIALNGGQDGLGCLRRIINNAYGYMKKEGVLILETGHDQKDGIKKIIDDCGEYKDVVFSKDYGGHDRVVTMRKK
jgi:release factor glutamine methyltransferase